jgi:hypothetical protein
LQWPERGFLEQAADGGRPVSGEDLDVRDALVHRVIQPMMKEALVTDCPERERERRTDNRIQS